MATHQIAEIMEKLETIEKKQDAADEKIQAHLTAHARLNKALAFFGSSLFIAIITAVAAKLI